MVGFQLVHMVVKICNAPRTWGAIKALITTRLQVLGFNSILLSVVGDIPVDSEALVVTSSISRMCRPSFRR